MKNIFNQEIKTRIGTPSVSTVHDKKEDCPDRQANLISPTRLQNSEEQDSCLIHRGMPQDFQGPQLERKRGSMPICEMDAPVNE